jgi:hypothetical protein
LFVRSIIDSLSRIEKVLFADATAKESPLRDASRRSANDCQIGQSDCTTNSNWCGARFENNETTTVAFVQARLEG